MHRNAKKKFRHPRSTDRRLWPHDFAYRVEISNIRFNLFSSQPIARWFLTQLRGWRPLLIILWLHRLLCMFLVSLSSLKNSEFHNTDLLQCRCTCTPMCGLLQLYGRFSCGTSWPRISMTSTLEAPSGLLFGVALSSRRKVLSGWVQIGMLTWRLYSRP